MEHLPSIYDTSGSVSSNTDSGEEGREGGREEEEGKKGEVLGC